MPGSSASLAGIPSRKLASSSAIHFIRRDANWSPSTSGIAREANLTPLSAIRALHPFGSNVKSLRALHFPPTLGQLIGLGDGHGQNSRQNFDARRLIAGLGVDLHRDGPWGLYAARCWQAVPRVWLLVSS